MATHHPSTTEHQQTCDTTSTLNSTIDCAELVVGEHDSSQVLDHHTHPSNANDNDIQTDANYLYYKDKFNSIKLQLPTDSENANILWSTDTSNPPHIGHLPYLSIMNILNKSHKTFLIISHLRGYFNNLNSELSEHDTKIQSYYEILNQFDIGTVIKSDEIYYTKDYQKSLFQLTRSVNIIEAIESIRKSMQKPIAIDMLRASDLMSILFILNDILYFHISHVLIEEHEVSLYKFISCLLSNEYGRTLKILEIPTLPNLHPPDTHSAFIEINQIHKQLYKLEPKQKVILFDYLKAMFDVLYPSEDKFLSDIDLPDIIDNIIKKISFKCNSPIYVAASFLTDQFHVLRKHWKKNVHKDDKCTGTGKGIDGLQANQQGFEPPLGGKFIIINWSNKEIVYLLDIDAPAGFFIENNYLYITNNRLNYISIIDLISQKEIQRIENSAFNCLHSLHRAENETMLVTSTGIDAIIQINLIGETLNDWYATEHEYVLTPKGEKRFIQRDLNHHHYIYPTLHQTTHINSAIILDSDYLLATLFHQGLLIKINRRNGKSEVLLSGLNCPHAIKRYKSMEDNEIEWMLCSTKQNELLFLNKDFKIIQKMILEDVNWLQDATQIQNEHIIITDANHSRIIEIDPNSNTVISEFEYSNDWRIYQISDLSDFHTNFIPEGHLNE